MRNTNRLFVFLLGLVMLLGSPASVRDAMAVSLSATGTGETLLFPYYTTRNGYDTYLTLTNTTNSGKAVRINFREAYGGKLVLGFNAYLSANDQWVAAVVANSFGGAKMISNDNSCTAPQIPGSGVDLVNYEYANPPDAFAITSLDRTADGYVEVIEMGQIPPGSQLASNITPVNGVPRDCSWVDGQIQQNGGYVSSIVLGGTLGLNAPTGGLTGKVDLISVRSGLDYAYSALAFNQFLAGARHTAALDDLDLDSAAPVATISGHLTNWSRGADAVSALLATRKLFGSFNLQAATNSATTLIALSPTRQFYAGRAPFSVAEPGCEPAGLSIFNSSGATMASIPASLSLCRTASIVGFGVDYGFNGDYILGAPLSTSVPKSNMGTEQGSFSLDLESTATITTTASSSVNLGGLPVVGLVLQEYSNGNVGGVSSNYGSALYAATDFNVFTFRTSVGSRETIDTLIKFAPSDIGKTGAVFVTAKVPSGSLVAQLGMNTSNVSHAKALATTAASTFVQIQLTATGWQQVIGGQLIPLASGLLGDLLAAQTILNGTDTTNLKGAQFCVGYGTSATEMITAGRMLPVATIPDTSSTSTSNGSCNVTLAPYTGLWWNSNESGWGMSITQHGSTVVNAMYTYDGTGQPTWYTMACPLAGTSCTGDIYKTSGGTSPTVPWNGSGKVTDSAGSGTLTFADANTGTFTYTLNNLPGSKPIARLVFATGSAPSVDYTDLWWNPSEDGWGVALTQQYGTISAAWYSYDATGKAVWYVGTCTVSGSSCTTSDLYQFTGGSPPTSAWHGTNPPTTVGTLSFAFTDANNGTMSYAINGVPDSRTIKRLSF